MGAWPPLRFAKRPRASEAQHAGDARNSPQHPRRRSPPNNQQRVPSPARRERARVRARSAAGRHLNHQPFSSPKTPLTTHHPNTKTKTPNNQQQQNPRNPIIRVTRGSDNTPRRAPVDYLPPQHANQRPKTQTTQPIFFADIRTETLIAGFQSSRNDRLCRICDTRCTTSSKLHVWPTHMPTTSGSSANSASSQALCITIEDLLSFMAKSLADCQNL